MTLSTILLDLDNTLLGNDIEPAWIAGHQNPADNAKRLCTRDVIPQTR